MSSSIIIELYNGVSFVRVNGRVDGADNFTVTLRKKDENGGITRSYSSELTFYDDGYQILKTMLLDPPTGFNNSVDVNIYDSCCNKLVFEGVIYGTKIDWCEPKCNISANIVERETVYSCIQSTLIYDSKKTSFLGNSFPKLRYCIEHRPIFMQVFLTMLMFLAIQTFLSIAYSLIPILVGITTIIWLVCNIVCRISSLDCSECQQFRIDQFAQEFFDFIQDLYSIVIPCGRFHPTPYVRDYINNVCKVCGLNFRSSILNDFNGRIGRTYFGLALLSAPVKKGKKYDSTDGRLIEDNLPIETLETLFENYLKPMFNADYQIIGNDLIFERKDYFYTTTQWIDSEALLLQDRIVNDEICYSWLDKDRWAYGVYKYSEDAQEYIGNEAMTRYKDIVEWNNPYSPTQKKDYQLTLPTSPIRAMKDRVEENNYELVGQLVYQFLMALRYFNYANDDTAIFAQHTMFNYKFIIIDENGGEAVVKRDYPDSFIHYNGIGYPGAGQRERFNYPMWFKEGQDGVYGYQNNLYSSFHYIDNPRLPSSVQYQFKFTFKFDCDDYTSFDYYKTVRLIRGGQVRFGKIEEITVDFTKRTMQVTGKVN